MTDNNTPAYPVTNYYVEQRLEPLDRRLAALATQMDRVTAALVCIEQVLTSHGDRLAFLEGALEELRRANDP